MVWVHNVFDERIMCFREPCVMGIKDFLKFESYVVIDV